MPEELPGRGRLEGSLSLAEGLVSEVGLMVDFRLLRIGKGRRVLRGRSTIGLFFVPTKLVFFSGELSTLLA